MDRVCSGMQLDAILVMRLASPFSNWGLAPVVRAPENGVWTWTKQGRIYAPRVFGLTTWTKSFRYTSTTNAQGDSSMLGEDTIGRTSHVWLYVSRYKIIFLQDARAIALRLSN